MKAMGCLGKGPYEISDVANKLGKTVQQVSIVRAQLIHIRVLSILLRMAR